MFPRGIKSVVRFCSTSRIRFFGVMYARTLKPRALVTENADNKIQEACTSRLDKRLTQEEAGQLLGESGRTFYFRQLQDFMARPLQIELDEPPVLQVIAALCHNELCEAMAIGKKEWIHVGPLQECFANYFDLDPSSLNPF